MVCILLTCMPVPEVIKYVEKKIPRPYSFLTYFILLNTMIPISLIVSLEFVHLFQCYFIEQDDDLARYKSV